MHDAATKRTDDSKLVSYRMVMGRLMTHKILKMISDAEDDGSGTIEYDEFLRMMTHMILNRDPGTKLRLQLRLRLAIDCPMDAAWFALKVALTLRAHLPPGFVSL